MSWTRRLSRPIGRFRRLADVRDFILAEFPDGPGRPWRHIGSLALACAEDDADMEDLEICLMLMVAHGGASSEK
jgi:hypothetical protein